MYMEKEKKQAEVKTMSKAQGDGFRTWTNVALNNYKEELRQRRLQLEDSKERWLVPGR